MLSSVLGGEGDQGNGLYGIGGTTKDFCYGELGVPSFVFEMGTEHFESCAYYEDNIVPDNLPAMIYAAKIARTPYITPAGPNAYGLAISADNVPSGTIVTLTAKVDDTQFNNSNGTESTQNIATAEYYVDTPPWAANSKPVAIYMSPSDGVFNNKVEIVEAQVDTTGWSDGQHIIFVRGQEARDAWGAFSAVFLNIGNPIPAITPSGGGGGGGDCFIATAVYCSSMTPHVKVLRDFRDRFLLDSSMSKAFVNLYYKYSPPVADFIAKHDNIRAIVRVSLLPVVGMSWVALKFGILATVSLMFFLGIGIILLIVSSRK